MTITERIRAKYIYTKWKEQSLITADYGTDIMEYIKSFRNINDFIIRCTIDNDIDFCRIPYEFTKDANFLVRLCSEDCTRLNDVYDSSHLFNQVIEAMRLSTLKNAITKSSIMSETKSAIKRYVKKVEKTQVLMPHSKIREIQDNKL